MPRQDYRRYSIHSDDADGASATAIVTARIKRANEVQEIDGDDPLPISCGPFPFLGGTTRNDLLNAYAARLDFRRAYKAANPSLPYTLNDSAPGEP